MGLESSVRRKGMQIYGPAQLHGAQSIHAPHTPRTAQTSQVRNDTAPIRDEVQISDSAQLIDQLRQIPDIRHDRVAAIRAQIASGAYETSDKLDFAIERLLDEIG
jgi:negative regulator of flagellin synthesis FlgM